MNPSFNPFQPFLDENGLLILDGGLATELENRGYDLDDTLWSARLLMDAPDAIKQVHLDYLTAGADCIISASYQASIPGFKQRGLREDEAEALLKYSVQLAIEARDQFWAMPIKRRGRLRPLVAASVGPYGAARADGSEYTGIYNLDTNGLLQFHQRRFHILAGTQVDLLACETIPSYSEAMVLSELLEQIPGRLAWFSFSCRDGKSISDGTPLTKCVEMIEGNEQIVAVGINCTAPNLIPDLISEIQRVSDKPILVYPNSGEDYDASTRQWLGISDSDQFADASKQWCAAGATIVGGCCRTGPEHIRQMRSLLIQ